MPTERDKAIRRIAREALGIETLETRGADSPDFHSVAAWAVREALERAYEEGRQAAAPVRTRCPACNRDIEIRPIPPN